MDNEEYIESGLSVGAIKYADLNEIITEEQVDYMNDKIRELDRRVDIIEDEIEAINNKIPELDERVGVIEDEIDEINSSLDEMGKEIIALEDGFSFYKNKNGYAKFPSGLIIQWGSWIETATETNSSATYTITFPISFPSSCLQVVPFASSFAATGNHPLQYCPSGVLSDCTVDFFKFKFSTTIDVANELKWVAIGY